ncbi:extracellular calcium-sensing receptor-like [Protopterus annectens]|uniref:extracellular calcium-sensing receptor-like n=1 Tax=Protopterus annectens TaxID=7888 RepID=UPI001CFAC314|nr:extracellular calcium-sensing receptor-like [Protopterus annectens]
MDDIFIKAFWEEAFGCKWGNLTNKENIESTEIPQCTGKENVQTIATNVYDLNNFGLAYSTYNSVYAVAYALNNMHLCRSPEGPLLNRSCADALELKQWLHSVKELIALSFLREDEVIPAFRELSKTFPADGKELITYFYDIYMLGRLRKKITRTTTHLRFPPVYPILFWNVSCLNDVSLPRAQNYFLHYLKHVSFITSEGEELSFDQYGDPPARYDIMNWQISSDDNSKFVRVGTFDDDNHGRQQLVINNNAIQWNEAIRQTPVSVCTKSCFPGFWKAVQKGEPVCCFKCVPCSKGEISNITDATECIKCPEDQWASNNHLHCIAKGIEFLSFEEPLGITLSTISISFGFITVVIFCIFIKNRDTPIVKANNCEMSFLLLLALMLCFLCSLVFIGKPLRFNCMFRQPAFGITFSLCVSVILAKTTTVVIAFSASKPSSKLQKWVGYKTPVFIVIVCTIVQVLICTCWASLCPSFPQMDMASQETNIINECNEGSIIAFCIVLGYLGILATVSFIVAFFARKLPDSFNEAKFITFSMLVFCSVWLSFIPAYLSTKGKYTVAVEIFAIVASSMGLLGCIFFPKCYVIVLKPELNTREYLIGKRAVTH